MILRNNLYRVVKAEDITGGRLYSLELLPNCPIYAAHFPGLPVTPGVCLLLLGKELLEETTGKTLHLSEVKNAKFLSVVSPIHDRQIECLVGKTALSESGKSIEAQVTLRSAQETKAKMSFACDIAQ